MGFWFLDSDQKFWYGVYSSKIKAQEVVVPVVPPQWEEGRVDERILSSSDLSCMGILGRPFFFQGESGFSDLRQISQRERK